jgi:hypothetical protein
MLFFALVGGGCRFVVGGLGVEDAPGGGLQPAPDLSEAPSPPDLAEPGPPKPDPGPEPDMAKPPPPPPQLSVTLQDRPLNNVSLSAEGTLDWAHWALMLPGDFNHKNGAGRISNLAMIGNQAARRTTQEVTAFSWSNGTPTTTMTDTRTAVFVQRTSSGFRFNVSCDGALHTLRVYVGGWRSRGRFEARFADGTLSYGDQSRMSFSDYDAMYRVEFRCAQSTNLVVDWYDVEDAGSAEDPGNVLLAAATLQ